MMVNTKWVDPRSLIVVLTAFIGNAEVFGVMIGLITLAVGILFLPSKLQAPNPATALGLLVLFFLLLVAAVRSPWIGIPYTDSYWLWPLQTIALLFLAVIGGPLRWPVGNIIAFAGLGVVIFGIGSVVDGRFYSVFGPNMLYRIFGFLFIFSFILYFSQKGVGRLSLLAVSGFGLLGTLLTGSIGAVVIVLAGLGIFVWRLSKALALALAVGSALGIWHVLERQSVASLAFNPDAPILLRRLAFKLENWETSHRFDGWVSIVLEGPTLTGHQYFEFAHLWFSGYLYPHNLFVELYGFFGLVGGAIGCFVIAGGIQAAKRAPKGDILSLSFIVLALGAMFSGDLTDNFGVIAFAAALLFGHRPESFSRNNRLATTHVAAK